MPEGKLHFSSASTGIWKVPSSPLPTPVFYVRGETIAESWDEFLGWLNFLTPCLTYQSDLVEDWPDFIIEPITITFDYDTDGYACGFQCDINLLYPTIKPLHNESTLYPPNIDGLDCYESVFYDCSQAVGQPLRLGFLFKFSCSLYGTQLKTFQEIMQPYCHYIYIPLRDDYEPRNPSAASIPY